MVNEIFIDDSKVFTDKTKKVVGLCAAAAGAVLVSNVLYRSGAYHDVMKAFDKPRRNSRLRQDIQKAVTLVAGVAVSTLAAKDFSDDIVEAMEMSNDISSTITRLKHTSHILGTYIECLSNIQMANLTDDEYNVLFAYGYINDDTVRLLSHVVTDEGRSCTRILDVPVDIFNSYGTNDIEAHNEYRDGDVLSYCMAYSMFYLSFVEGSKGKHMSNVEYFHTLLRDFNIDNDNDNVKEEVEADGSK